MSPRPRPVPAMQRFPGLQLTVLTVALLGCATAGATEPASPQWYAGAELSHVQPDSERDARNAAGGGLLVGLPLGYGINAELNAFGHRFKTDNGAPEVPVWGGGLDLTYTPSLGNGRVFGILGGGWASERLATVSGVDENNLPQYERERSNHGFVRAGIGFYVPGMRQRLSSAPTYFRSHWLLRADLSWYGAIDAGGAGGETNYGDVRLNVGLLFLRTTPPRLVPPLPPGPAPEVVPTAGQQ